MFTALARPSAPPSGHPPVASHWRLTEQLLEEARWFELRSACRDCFFWSEQRGECWHGWPDEGQRRWRSTRPAPDGERPDTVAFCKELELR